VYRVLIVDDEPPARHRLLKALDRLPNVSVAGEASNGQEAVDMLVREVPDIVLLDIEMPHGDGFYVVEEAMKHGLAPEVIFVTAFDRFAIDAFEYGAIDYLLKPPELSRVETALKRAMERIELRSAQDRALKLQALIETRRLRTQGQDEHQVEDDLWVKESSGRRRVPLDTVLSITADRDYVRIDTEDQSYHVRGTIAKYEAQLQDRGYLRIHRSFIVRRGAVVGLISKGQNSYEVELSNGQRLQVGRSYNAEAKNCFGAASSP